MSAIQTFPLSVPLILPKNEGEDMGYDFFPAPLFGIGYEGYAPDADASQIKARLVVRRMDDFKTVHVLKEFLVTKEGVATDEVLNQTEIDAATDAREKLQQDIAVEEGEIATLEATIADLVKAQAVAEGKDLPGIITQIAAAQSGLDALKIDLEADKNALAEIVVPAAEYGREFTFDEVVAWFDNKGRILPAALDAALSIKFKGIPMSVIVKAK
jgi:DNA-binding FrmR family transcriptional regulator